MRRRVLPAALLLLAGCTDWQRFSQDYEGPGICPTYVVTADTHTCVRKGNGALFCWGDNRFGQLGTGDLGKHGLPTRVNFGALGTAKIYAPTGNGDISADLTGYTCSLASDNQFWCWGDNRFGQLGSGDMQSVFRPRVVEGLSGTVSKAAIGSGHVCVQTTDGQLYCWGRNVQGELGVGDTQPRPAPVLVDVGLKIERISAGGDFTCAQGVDGTLLCWGANARGQLGTGTMDGHSKPAAVTALGTRVARLTTGGAHTCVFTADDGQVWCWGDNGAGQLGTGDTDRRLLPTAIDPRALGAVKANQVWAGGNHTCALRDDNSFWCWGGNRFGQLGTGDTSPRLTPIQVLANVAAAYAGGAHTCAIKTDGSLWCWGNNQYGQLGVEVGSESLIPVQVMPPCQ